MKTYLSNLAFLLIAFVGQTQTVKNPTQIFNEARFSINYSATDNTNISNTIGFGTGIYHTSFKESKVNLVAGLGYTRTNLTAESRTLSFDEKLENIKYAFHKIAVPVTARFNFDSKAKVFAELGPQFNVNLTLREEGNKVRNGQELGIFSTKSNTYSNLSALGALGAILPFKNKEILIRAAYTYNFNNYNIGFKQDWIMTNHYFSLGVGYKW